MNAFRYVFTCFFASSALFLSACSGGSGNSSTPTSTEATTNSPTAAASPTPAIDTQETLEDYFKAFATGDPEEMEIMRQVSEPDSPADLYALHQINLAKASIAAGQRAEVDRVTVSSDQVTITSATGDRNPDVYTDFIFDSQGRLVTWTVEEAGPLDGRISALEGFATFNGLEFRLQTAYETNGGDLFFTFKATNDGQSTVDLVLTDYISPSGQQVEVQVTPFVISPRPGAFIDGSASIVRGEPGGTLVLQFDYLDQQDLPLE